MARNLAPLLLAVAAASASAVTPLTPGFDAPTHARMVRQLERAQVPAVGHNSVVIAISRALGFEAQSGTSAYDEPYRHLPKVHVNATVERPGCAFISAVIEGAADAGYAKVLATGNFCLVGPARWSSTDFVTARTGER